MKTKPLSLTFTACLVLLALALGPEIAMSQQIAAQSAISETAKQYGLGAARAGSPQAIQILRPRSDGDLWWQPFERGWVYWHRLYGVRLVNGKIFETWGAQRWEQGPLGFPTRSESQCSVPDSRDRYQVFEGGRIYWRAATNEGIVFNNPTNFGDGGNCNPPPDVSESVFYAPYTSSGTSGTFTDANPAAGLLGLWNRVLFAGSTQKVAFITQTFPVGRGIRQVKVSALIDDVYYYLDGLAYGAGYSSAEAIVNLRVMKEGRVLCSDRISLDRLITVVVGGGYPEHRRVVTLRCEFTRAAPADATTYTVFADIEGWAGAGGFSHATVSMSATIRRFNVLQDRR